MQWSLKSLLIATAVIPVAIFAIAKSTPFWVSAVVTVAALAWIAVAIMAWVEAGQRRAWARGMVVAATGYAILIFTLGTETRLYGSRLATSHLLAYVYGATHEPQQLPTPVFSTALTTSTVVSPSLSNTVDTVWLETALAPQTASTVWSYPVQQIATIASPQPNDFGTIGHIYWGVLLALVGGWFAAWIERRQKQESEKTQTAS